jgi:hypothetical protein
VNWDEGTSEGCGSARGERYTVRLGESVRGKSKSKSELLEEIGGGEEAGREGISIGRRQATGRAVGRVADVQIFNDVIDQFIQDIMLGGARLARHRKSDKVEMKDMALYLGE